MMAYQGLEGEALQKVLKARASELAKNLNNQDSQTQKTSFLVFCLGDEEKYAIAYDNIERVCTLTSLTRLPGITSFFSGVTYYNARVWPVIDMEKFLYISTKNHLSAQNIQEPEHLILLQDGAHGYALSVKYVIGHMQLDVSEIAARPGNKAASNAYILGVCQSDITVIDVKAMLEHINHLSFSET
jgi:chemotaxis signal transduction protein